MIATAAIGAPLAAALLIAGTSGAPAASRCPTPLPIVLDIGHSTKRPGATSARGKPEYAFNERLVRELAATLAPDARFEIRILNAADEDISLAARARRVKTLARGLLLSIHHDSVQPIYLERWSDRGKSRRYSDRFQGFSLFVSQQSPAFARARKLGEALGESFVETGMTPSLHHAEAIKGENRPLLDADIGLYRFDGLAVLRHARIPAVLIEVGIIVNRREEEVLETPAFRGKVVAAIERGITAYCKLR